MNFLDRNIRVLNITHCDLDGSVAGIVTKRFYADCTTFVTNYGREKGLSTVEYIKSIRNKIDAVVFTDFSPIDFVEEMNELKIPYMILDHHESALPLNDPKNGMIVNTKFCGAKLAYLYYVRIAKELECLKELVELANDYDCWIHNDRRSKYLNTVHWCYYGFDNFYERFKFGFNGFNEFEKGEILKAHNQFKKIWDEMPLTDLPHNGCICNASTLISEISIQLEKEGYEWFIIFNDLTCKFHLRSRTDKVDWVPICRDVLKRGGGHSRASSCDCNPDEVEPLLKLIVPAIEKCYS